MPDETTSASAAADTTSAGQDAQQAQQQGYTQADLDRAVSKAIETHRKKWEAEAATQMETARTEAEKLARMSEQERLQHTLKEREAALAAKERELTRKELRAQAAAELAKRGVPADFADFAKLDDADACQASIDLLSGTYLAALEAGIASGVMAKVGGTAPKTGAAEPEGPDLKKLFPSLNKKS